MMNLFHGNTCQELSVPLTDSKPISRAGRLIDLIKRLECATGPDRRLDFDIWVATTNPSGFPALGEPDEIRTQWFEGWKDRNGFPFHTSSIDAAMMLIPEGWNKDIWLKRHNSHHWSCDLHIPSHENCGRHVSLPIAICIAALRARCASEHDTFAEGPEK